MYPHLVLDISTVAYMVRPALKCSIVELRYFTTT